MALILAAAAIPYVPIVAYEAVQVTKAVVTDIDRGTTRNTSEAAVGAVAGVVGASGGAILGAATIPAYPLLGATVGATMTGIAADVAAREQANKFFDRHDYNVQIRTCKECGRNYKCRMYTYQSRDMCKKCANEEYLD